MALCKLVQKSNSDGRKYLQQCVKNDYQLQYGEYFEKAWLLSADQNIANNKNEQALADLEKCLRYNKSLSKAEEFRGYIKEKEKSF